MKNQKLVIALACLAVAAVLAGCILVFGYFSKSDSPVPESPETVTETEYRNIATTAPFASESNPYFTLPPEVTGATEFPSQPVTTLTDGSTVPATQPATQPSSNSNVAFSQVFSLPLAPIYYPPDVDINFDSANLASYKFDPDGNFYYTDDKNCWQKNFGFNEGYDSMAPLGMMNYDTVRTKFVYGGQEWLIQMWKGQYGYSFVGGEVGVYTRPVGSSGTHYNCATEADWLNMEMAFMWDEHKDGNYRAVFNRDYTKYWWCTGFVVGFETGNDRSQFRLVHHITFKDEAMANAFCEAFAANGFRRVDRLNSNVPDTFVQVGPDVAFVWQEIAHN